MLDKNIKNIVFDFGGVLIDWNPRHLYRKYFKTEEEMEYFLSDICTPQWNALQDAGRPFAEAVARLKAEHPEYSEAIGIYFSRWDEMIGGAIERNVDLLKKCKKDGYGIYGLTNWSAETLPRVMRKYDFFKLFDGIVVSGVEKCIKPDPKLYRILFDRYGLNPSECLFIDDSPANLETAGKLGMHTSLPGQDAEELLNG